MEGKEPGCGTPNLKAVGKQGKVTGVADCVVRPLKEMGGGGVITKLRVSPEWEWVVSYSPMMIYPKKRKRKKKATLGL